MTPQELVAALKNFAGAEGYTQSDLARALSVDRQRVSGWFTQRRIPNAEHALAIDALLRREKRRAQRARVARSGLSRNIFPRLDHVEHRPH